MLKKFLPLFILLFSATAYSQDYNWFEDLEEDDQINTCESTLIANNDDGQMSNYNHTLVICPDQEGLLSTIDFTEFDIPDNNFTNQFVIYDGDNTDAPVLFTEEDNLPNGGFISATEDNPTGCLTIVYQADFIPPTFTGNIGFDAVIDCREPCQELEAFIVDITGNDCSTSGSGSPTFLAGSQITFEGFAETSNDTPLEDLNFSWVVQGPGFGNISNVDLQTWTSTPNMFTEPGTYLATLTVTDEFFCESESAFFNFTIAEDRLTVEDVNEQFTLQQLIEDVMVGGGECAVVDGITSPNNAGIHTNNESIGYFTRGCSNFPFEDGLVIGSGFIESVLTPGASTGGFSWPGDPVMTTVASGGSGTNNATIIEFEFSSFENEVEFNYIFASYEYPGFICNFADPFAFIVSGPYDEDGNFIGDDYPDGTPGVFQDTYDYNHDANPNNALVSQNLGGLNIATVPDANGNPVPTTPTNTHDGNCSGGLGQFNLPQFFDQLNPDYHDINGQTTVLTASTEVIPCERYKMRLMVADYGDSAFDSYVFIEGGSFNIGADLGEDIDLESEDIVCYGEDQELTIFGGTLDPNCEISIEWFFNGDLIEDENDATIIVTEPGTYTVFVGGDAGCNDEDSIEVQFLPTAEYEFQEDQEFDEDEEFSFPDVSFCGEGGELENGLLVIDPFEFLAHNGVGQPIPSSASSLEDLGMEAHYFFSEQEAIDFENPIENPEDFTIPPGNFVAEICIRVNENLTGDRECPVVECFNLIFFEEPDIDEDLVEDMTNCGDFTPPTQIFDLTQNNASTIGVQDPTIVDVTYHITEVDAESGDNPIENPETYTLPDNLDQQTIFIRAQNTGSDECYDVATFEIFQYNVEIGNSPLPTIEECEIGDSGEGVFNLTQQNGLVLGANQQAADYSISYFEDFADANGGVNPIADPTAFVSVPQEIWVRIDNVNSVEDCFAIDSFQIDTIETTDVNLEVTPLEACDENNDGFFSGFDLASRVDEINFLEDPEVQVSFHPTASDAETGQNPLASPYANVVPSQQTLYVRIFQEIEDLQCVQTTTLDLFVYDSPLLEEIEPIIACDTNETGIQFFDLTQVEENLFVEGQNTEDFEITYHLSENAANNNTGIIGNPTAYQNQTSPQTVYVRVSDPTSPLDCFNIEPIELIVDPLPEITPPTLLAECDDVESGSTTDETSSFDLSQKIEEITNANNALEVVFYANESDQENNNPITDINNYQNTENPQTIEISVFSDDTDCVATTTLTLVVDPLPTIPTPEPLVVCDADNEGTSEFDLQAAVEDILDGEVNTQITYHLTEVDANNGDNAIAIADEDNEPILFQNTNPFSQTLYIRAENIGDANINGTGCFTIQALELQVEESPRIQTLDDLVICDDDTLNGFAAFNLAQNTANAIGDQDAENLTLTYHETQADAEEGINPIAVPSNYTNNTNPQSIYVRLADEETGCIDQFGFTDDNSFTISVEAYPDLSTPTPLEVCNTQANPEANFPTGNFDLTQKQEELTGLSPVPGSISFSYYESETDLNNQENQIADPTDYINASNPPMLIYVEATNTNTENQCSNTSTITLNVLPLPFPVELSQEERRLTACDDDNDGVAAAPFDLTQIGQQITGSENNVGSYYLSEEAANNEDDTEEIQNPDAYVNDPSLNEVDEDFFPTNTQVVWLRLDSNAAGNFCSTITPIEIIVEPNPELNPAGQPFGYTLCEGDPTQLPSPEEIAFSLYDATNGSPSEIIPVLDPNNENQNQANYEYSFHLTEANAEANTNALGEGYQATNGQTLYLRVTHIVTGCYNIDNIAEVQITIEPRPDITDEELTPIVVCADEVGDDPDNTQADNQEVATVDLTQKDEEIDPNFNNPDVNTMVEYYASQEDYNNGIAIADPTSFTTNETPTTIIAEVIDLDNFCNSSESQSFEIRVNPIPLVDITDMDGAIVCIDPQTGEVIETDFSPPILDTELSEEDYAFEWILNGNPIAFTGSAYAVQAPGLYTVTVTDLTNNLTSCQASSTAEIIQSNGPDFEVNVLSQAFDGSHSVEVTNIQGDGNYEFAIDNGPWRSLSEGQQSIIFTDLEAGDRVVRGRDVGGCGEVTIPVSLIDYPQFFTPNEDGYNDRWNIIGLANQSNAKIYIFDRYGKLLKQLSPSSPGWDGTYNGKALPGNDYWFSVQYEEPSSGVRKEFKANFTLKR